MTIRVINVKSSKTETHSNVKTVLNRGKCFKVVFNDGSEKQYPFSTFDFVVLVPANSK